MKPSSQRRTILTSQNHTSNPGAIIQRARIDPKSLTTADILQLQRTIGNRAVGRLLSEIGRPPSTAQQLQIQKQEIPEEEEPLQGMFENKFEKAACTSCSIDVLQKQELEEEEKPLQGKMIDIVQRQEIPEEEEPLQGVFEKKLEQSICSSSSTAYIQRKEENRTGMPDYLKAGVENLSGIDMSDVRVHYNSSKPAEIGALAYTQGVAIHVAPGQEKHLAHEVWHVVQQAQSRVKPTMQLKDIAVNDDEGLEHEADVMGGRASIIGMSKNEAPQLKQGALSFSHSQSLLQLLKPDIYSTDAFRNPSGYLLNKVGFQDTNFIEDEGSGGILDEPMRNLVKQLGTKEHAEFVIETISCELNRRMEKSGNVDDADTWNETVRTELGEMITGLRNVQDSRTAYEWVRSNTLRIPKYFPKWLRIVRSSAPNPIFHTFHRDHGYVKLTRETLKSSGINSSSEQNARMLILNGPFNQRGWVRGHSSLLFGGIQTNKKHLFIEHVHVDKDDQNNRFEIYNTNDQNDIQKADGHNLESRQGLSAQNDNHAESAIESQDTTAESEAWTISEQGCSPDPF